MQGNNPFVKASTRPKPLKMLIYGHSGSRKTRTALAFPAPCMIDMEAGSDHYGDEFSFDVCKATTVDALYQATDWLKSNRNGYSTLIIDPITVYWTALQEKHSDANYEIQLRTWGKIKMELKSFVNSLMALDMNVICTARQKPKMECKGREVIQTGVVFDGEKSLPYWFDVVVRVWKREKDPTKSVAIAEKDRTCCLPEGNFWFSYPELAKYFGGHILGNGNGKSTPCVPSPSSLEEKNHHFEEIKSDPNVDYSNRQGHESNPPGPPAGVIEKPKPRNGTLDGRIFAVLHKKLKGCSDNEFRIVIAAIAKYEDRIDEEMDEKTGVLRLHVCKKLTPDTKQYVLDRLNASTQDDLISVLKAAKDRRAKLKSHNRVPSGVGT